MGIKKIFKVILIAIVLFLVSNVLSFYYGKIQCNRMIDAIRNNDITKLRWISTFSNPNTVSDTLIKTAMSESERYTPLGEACKVGNFEMVKLLVEDGADVNYVPILTEASPLGLAAESNSNDNLKIVKYLIEHGADVNFSRGKFDFPAYRVLSYRGARPNVMEILKVLLEAGADPEKNEFCKLHVFKRMRKQSDTLLKNGDMMHPIHATSADIVTVAVSILMRPLNISLREAQTHTKNI